MSHKLVSLHIGDGEFYTRIDVDNVIAELKAATESLFSVAKSCILAHESCKGYDRSTREGQIAHFAHNMHEDRERKEARIAELEKDLKFARERADSQWDYHKRMERYWMGLTNFYARSMWLTRAKEAVAEQAIDNYERYKGKHPCSSVRDFDEWSLLWKGVERLCLKKAEEYK